MHSHLFLSLPIGTLFFRDPFNPLENPSIKEDDTHARNPNGEVVEVNGGVLVFTGAKPQADNKPIPVTISVPVGNAGIGLLHDRSIDDFFNSLETSLETK
jgi:hypothetical protein